jgi:hypothetical protein
VAAGRSWYPCRGLALTALHGAGQRHGETAHGARPVEPRHDAP